MKHRIELDQNFELGDDPWITKLHRWAIPSMLVAAYLISASALCGIVVFANWLIKNYG